MDTDVCISPLSGDQLPFCKLLVASLCTFQQSATVWQFESWKCSQIYIPKTTHSVTQTGIEEATSKSKVSKSVF